MAPTGYLKLVEKFFEEFWVHLTAGAAVLIPAVVGLVRAWLKAKTASLRADAEQAATSVEKMSDSTTMCGEDKMKMAQSMLAGPLSSRPPDEQREMIEEVLPDVRRQLNSKRE